MLVRRQGRARLCSMDFSYRRSFYVQQCGSAAFPWIASHLSPRRENSGQFRYLVSQICQIFLCKRWVPMQLPQAPYSVTFCCFLLAENNVCILLLLGMKNFFATTGCFCDRVYVQHCWSSTRRQTQSKGTRPLKTLQFFGPRDRGDESKSINT